MTSEDEPAETDHLVDEHRSRARGLNDEVQLARGRYLEVMALADKALTEWFLYRLGVRDEAMELFRRLVGTGQLGARIQLFRDFAETPEHKELGQQLEEQNAFRNRLAHGMLFPAADTTTSFPEIGKDWEIEVSNRTGVKKFPVTAAEIEARRAEVLDLANRLLRLTVGLVQ